MPSCGRGRAAGGFDCCSRGRGTESIPATAVGLLWEPSGPEEQQRSWTVNNVTLAEEVALVEQQPQSGRGPWRLVPEPWHPQQPQHRIAQPSGQEEQRKQREQERGRELRQMYRGYKERRETSLATGESRELELEGLKLQTRELSCWPLS